MKRLLLYALFPFLITVVASCGNSTPVLAPTVPGGGNSIEDAIKVGSIGEERDIMNRWSCGGDGHFRKASVNVVERNARHYDVIEAECTRGPETRQFFFDVSSCFPCPD